MQAIRRLCEEYRVRELALFGSALRNDFRPESDFDLLVDFQPDVQVGFLALNELQRKLSEVLHRPVDLVPKGGLKKLIRERIISEAKVLYAA